MDENELPGEGQIEPTEERTALDPSPQPTDPLLEELKHSIRIHLIVMNGPSQQLCVYLVKLIDLLEDQDRVRRRDETAKLAFSIIEAVVLYIHQAIDSRAQQAQMKHQDFPQHIQDKSNNLLVVLGKSRGLPDKIVAKNALLKEVAEALRALSIYTRARYPDITDVAGNII